MKKNSGVTLTELLMTICLIAVLAAMFLPAITRGFKNAKAWIIGIYAFHENRMNAFMDGNTRDQYFYATNKPTKWVFIDEHGHVVK